MSTRQLAVPWQAGSYHRTRRYATGIRYTLRCEPSSGTSSFTAAGWEGSFGVAPLRESPPRPTESSQSAVFGRTPDGEPRSRAECLSWRLIEPRSRRLSTQVVEVRVQHWGESHDNTNKVQPPGQGPGAASQRRVTRQSVLRQWPPSPWSSSSRTGL